ncbi:RNA-binding RNA processing protein RPP1, partial [Ascoidea rubescens DSM 1968]
MLCDLNIPWPQTDYSRKPSATEIDELKQIVLILEEFSYTHIAFNFQLNADTKLPDDINNVNPINLSLFTEFHDRIKIYTRLTFIVDDPSKFQNFKKISNYFDIVSVQPKSEKIFTNSVSGFEMDMISFNFSERLPFFLKHSQVCGAVNKGIKFEINYSTVISGPKGFIQSTIDNKNNNQNSKDNINNKELMHSRKIFFNNVKSLIRTSRGRGLVFSSGAVNSLQIRSLFDIINFAVLLGLKQSRAKTSLDLIPSKVLINGRLRIKSYKQTIMIGND